MNCVREPWVGFEMMYIKSIYWYMIMSKWLFVEIQAMGRLPLKNREGIVLFAHVLRSRGSFVVHHGCLRQILLEEQEFPRCSLQVRCSSVILAQLHTRVLKLDSTEGSDVKNILADRFCRCSSSDQASPEFESIIIGSRIWLDSPAALNA